ncbi:MAG: hypothetical protein ACI358_07455 [Candidatus Limimorpha sp.]
MKVETVKFGQLILHTGNLKLTEKGQENKPNGIAAPQEISGQ